MSIYSYKKYMSDIEQKASALKDSRVKTCDQYVQQVTDLGGALSAFDAWNGMAKFYYATDLDAKMIIAARTTYLNGLNSVKYHCKDCSTPTINGLRPRRR